MTTVLRVLALAMLLAVRARTLSNGTGGYYGWTGGERFTKLDRFLQDRMGVGGSKSEPAASQTAVDHGLWSRTAIAASVAVPQDEDDGAEDDDENDDEEEEEPRKPVKLRHWNRWEEENTVNDRNIQKLEPTRTMSPLSENKWKLFGSRRTIEETMRSSVRMKQFQNNNEAYNHQIRMSKEASCKVPRAKVIKVSDVYPSSNKIYMPSCTVLHVCGDDTGCCGSSTLKCGPKSSHAVNLHFFVYTALKMDDQQSNEKSLLFYNHTECECQSRTEDTMPRDTVPTTADFLVNRPMHWTGNTRLPSCKCPTEYTVRYLPNGSCSCDCFDKQHECIRYKKGKLKFNQLDQDCIFSGQCLLPMCDHGVYSHQTGRCPQRLDYLYSLKNKHYF
ncbi:Cystine-knot cytokine,PDGF/VEGF domain [Cinara cedri]|uniref:Cystine-knot cytokine,PDGF/VEGF domain n=1 Tax=Cinara cedri TaxID=506608 RepID=A0A5E4NK18_9HEMI|nr:Cystine-knot cytokine,PDGF/VEGF domain [Cinara cedri]